MFNLLSIIVGLCGPVTPPFEMSKLERAIWAVESSCHPGGVPMFSDKGFTAGPYCLSKGAMLDSGVAGKWPDAVFDLQTSVDVFRGFQARYNKPHRLPAGTSYDYAAALMWNGGPNALKAPPGSRKWKRLQTYWGKVQRQLARLP